jgi:hypothetical protein
MAMFQDTRLLGRFQFGRMANPAAKTAGFLVTRNSIVIINAHQRKLDLSLQAATLPGIQESPLYAKKLK